MTTASPMVEVHHSRGFFYIWREREVERSATAHESSVTPLNHIPRCFLFGCFFRFSNTSVDASDAGAVAV